MFRLVERIGEHGLPAFVHIIAGSFLESAWRLGVLADAFPDVVFVALDGFSSPDQAGSMIPFAHKHPNVMFDTGVAATVAHGMPAFIREVGAHRLLLGTDFYSSPRLFETPYALYELLNSGLAEEELAQVFGRNARQLLGLTA